MKNPDASEGRMRMRRGRGGSRCAARVALPGLLGVLAGCTQGEMNVEVVSEATEDSPLYEHAGLYLTAHPLFDTVTARLDCQDEAAEACLLRIEANERVYDGPASTLILHIATGVQPLPGPVDLAGSYQDAYDVEPVTWATVEDVGFEDPARRYNYVCRSAEGSLVLEQKPEIDGPLTGQLEVTVSCVEQLAPDVVVPASIRATFETVVEASPY